MLGRTTASGGKDNRYFKLKLAELTGLERAQIETGSTRVSFQLKRRAGRFDFDGAFARRKGTGTFSFTAEPEFIAAMERAGYAEGLRRTFSAMPYATTAAKSQMNFQTSASNDRRLKSCRAC